MLAISNSDLESARILIESGLNKVDSKNKSEQTAAMMIFSQVSQKEGGFSSKEQVEILDLMAKHNKKEIINGRDKFGNTALHYAIASGNDEVVEKITSIGTSISKHDENAIIAAYTSCNPHLIQMAHFQSEISVDDLSKVRSEHFGNTVIGTLASSEKKESSKILEDLLKKASFDVNAQDKNGVSGLMAATFSGDVEKVKMLLKRPDININAQDANGNTALMIACKIGDKSIIENLIQDKRIQINLKNQDGITAFTVAAHQHIQKEERVSSQKDQKVWKGDQSILKALIDRGADPVIESKQGKSIKTRMVSALLKICFYTGISKLVSYFAPGTSKIASVLNSAQTANIISQEASGVVHDKIREFLSENQMDISKNCMIGNYHVDTLGNVISGSALQNQLVHNASYDSKTVKDGIFTAVQLNDAINAGKFNNEQRYEYHQKLVAQYGAIEEAKKDYYLPWTKSALSKIQKEILNTDKNLMNPALKEWRQDGNKFDVIKEGLENKVPSIANFLKVDPKIAAGILHNKEGKENKVVLNVLQQIEKSEILANPQNTIAATKILNEFQKIELKGNAINVDSKKHLEYIKSYDSLKVGIETSKDNIKYMQEDAKMLRGASKGEIFPKEEKQNYTMKNIVNAGIGKIADLFGVSKQDVKNKIINTASTTTRLGVFAGGFYAQEKDLSNAALGFAGQLGGVALTAVSSAATVMSPALPALAVAAGSYGIYKMVSGKDTEISKEEMQKEISNLGINIEKAQNKIGSEIYQKGDKDLQSINAAIVEHEKVKVEEKVVESEYEKKYTDIIKKNAVQGGEKGVLTR